MQYSYRKDLTNTMASQNNAGSSASDRARENARRIADRQSRGQGGAPKGLIAGVIALVLVIAVIIGLVVWQNNKTKTPDSGPVPASANQYGGIVVGKDGIVKDASDVDERSVEDVPEAPETPDTSKTPPGVTSQDEAKKSKDPVQVVIFQDFNCPHCGEFEEKYAGDIKKAMDEGDVTVEYRNLNFLDRMTPDKYSSRAANAAYLVAEQVSPDQYMEFTQEVLSHTGQGGLSDQQLADIASKHGADLSAEQLGENTYRPMIDVMSKESTANGVSGTPTVFVDGKRFEQGDFSDVLKKAVKANS